jgi:hypothetical protein
VSTHWRAPVRKVQSATHVLSYMQGEDLVSDAEAPSHVEIRAVSGSFYLMRMSREGKCIYDTWHLTLAEAKAQAELEFAIEDREWIEVRD